MLAESESRISGGEWAKPRGITFADVWEATFACEVPIAAIRQRFGDKSATTGRGDGRRESRLCSPAGRRQQAAAGEEPGKNHEG